MRSYVKTLGYYVGSFSEKDFDSGKAQSKIETMQKETQCEYAIHMAFWKGGKLHTKVYVCNKDEAFGNTPIPKGTFIDSLGFYVGTYNKKDLADKIDHKEIEEAMKRHGVKYNNTVLVKKGNEAVALKTYVCGLDNSFFS